MKNILELRVCQVRKTRTRIKEASDAMEKRRKRSLCIVDLNPRHIGRVVMNRATAFFIVQVKPREVDAQINSSAAVTVAKEEAKL